MTDPRPLPTALLRAAMLVLLALALMPATVAGEPQAITVTAAPPAPAPLAEGAADPAAPAPPALYITINPSGPRVVGLLQVVEPATERVLRTLHAGRFERGQRFALAADDPLLAVPDLRLRYRERLGLSPQASLPAPNPAQRWWNPTDIVVRGEAMYVVDAGLAVPDPVFEPRQWTPADGAPLTAAFVQLHDGVVRLVDQEGTGTDHPLESLSPSDQQVAQEAEQRRQAALAEREQQYACVYKIGPDGAADTSWGDGGSIDLGGMYSVRALAVDDEGKLFITSGSHYAVVYDSHGQKTEQIIGGWDGDPHGPKCTVWVNSLALGRENRIYLPNSYGHFKVYDRTKNGFDGVLMAAKLPQNQGLDRAVCVDAHTDRVYLATQGHLVQRWADSGSAIEPLYATDAALKLAHPTGLFASAGLVWASCHGPGFGPYWDSGGGGEVVLLFDDGESLRLVERFGRPGTGTRGLQFLNPSGLAMSPDHAELWVVEDGAINKEGPPGNARIRRFAITAERVEEAPLAAGGS